MASETVAAGTAVGLVGGFFFFIIFLWFIFVVVGILTFIFWILMIVDVAERKFKNDNDRIVWILVVVLAHIIGAIIYYFVIKKPDRH